MRSEFADFDTTRAAAAGEDPALLAELRAGFLESLAHQIDLLSRARCDANWHIAAQRRRGLGASFHAPALQKLAEEAEVSAPGEPAIIRKLQAFAAAFPRNL